MKAQGIIDYSALMAELEVALGHSEFYLSGEDVKVLDGSWEQLATVRGDGLDPSVVQAVLTAHILATPQRKKFAEVDSKIKALESSITSRMLRDAVLGDTTRIQEVEDKIKLLRSERAK